MASPPLPLVSLWVCCQATSEINSVFWPAATGHYHKGEVTHLNSRKPGRVTARTQPVERNPDLSPSASGGLLFLSIPPTRPVPPIFFFFFFSYSLPRERADAECLSCFAPGQIFPAEWVANVNCDWVPVKVRRYRAACGNVAKGGGGGLGLLCERLWKVSAHKGFLLPSCFAGWLTPNGYFCNSSFFGTSKQRRPALLTHTHTHTAESGRKLVPDFSWSEAWTRAASRKPWLNLNQDWARTTSVTGKPKPELEPNQNPVQALIFFTPAHKPALNYKWFGGKSGEGCHQQCSPSPHRLPGNSAPARWREWLMLLKYSPAFRSQGLLAPAVPPPPQHLFQNSPLPLSPPLVQSLLGWGRGLGLLGGLAVIAVPQLVK